MTEYIKREALRDALYEADAITMEGVKILNQFPAADVEPARNGHWIVKHTALGKSYTICSNCGYDSAVVIDGHFLYLDLTGAPRCLNCGAKMEEVSE